MFNDNMFSDDDEEIVEYISSDFFNRRVAERTDYFDSLRDKRFHRRFRLEKESVVVLLEKIKDKLEYTNETKNQAVTPMNQLLCALRFYATGSQITTSGDLIGVHESTACRIIHRVTDAIARLTPQYLCMPGTEEERRGAASKFHDIARFPRVIGTIGCTHVRIKSPGGHAAEIYRNRKGYFSINMQAICSADLKFNDVVARWHGSAQNSHIWDNCHQRRLFLEGTYGNYSLLGDSGYPQTPFMMTPLPMVYSSSQSSYNDSHAQTTNTVERTFDIWKRRFPITSRGIQVHLNKVPGIIMATCVLHNIARLQNDPLPPLDPEYPPMFDADDASVPASSSNTTRDTFGHEARQYLVDEYFSR